MPSDANATLYKRLIETGTHIQVALDENADAQVFLALLEQHRGVMAELKQVKTENNPEILLLMKMAKEKVIEVMEQICIKRDGMAGEIMQSKSRKRAFDVYNKI